MAGGLGSAQTVEGSNAVTPLDDGARGSATGVGGGEGGSVTVA